MGRADLVEGGRGWGMGNPREISTRTCNGESAFLADGSDVDDDDEEGGGRKIKEGRKRKEGESGERRRRVKSFPWNASSVGAGSLGATPSLARRNLSVRSRRLTMWPPR